MGILAANLWVKLILRLLIEKSFGPLLKLIIKMIKDLRDLIVIWVIFLLMFAAIFNLLFVEVTVLFQSDYFVTFYKMFEYSLGSFNVSSDDYC